MMSGIRATNTKPELQIRKALHALGFRYRLHAKDIPGNPDLVLPRYRAVIFINGCFWHGHDCPLYKVPDTRREFWEAKIDRNRKRDQEVHTLLEKAGWRYLTVWECALRGREKLGLEETVDLIAQWLRDTTREKAEIRGSRRSEAEQ